MSLWVELERSKTRVPLVPPDDGPGTRVLHSPFHTVKPAIGVQVLLRHGSEAPRKLRRVVFSVVGQAGRWEASWGQWSFIVRRTPESQGGAEISAQDRLSADGQRLTLLLRPEDDEREATLEFHVPLGAGVVAGDYPFVVRVIDEEDPNISDSVEGTLQLFHPATPLLDYLPHIYREAFDAESELGQPGEEIPPFFLRYLRGIDDVREPLHRAIGQLYLLFGPETAPSEFLPWLGGWVALVLDDNWPELRRRRLIREAVSLYRQRGTRQGLSRHLELYTGVKPQISDQPFIGMRLGSKTQMGSAETARLGNIPPHTFVVALSVPGDQDYIREATVRAIIESQKPVHTQYRLLLTVGAPGRN